MGIEWFPLKTKQPEADREVLLKWNTNPPIYRIAQHFTVVQHHDKDEKIILWKYYYDFGDHGSWAFSNRDDEQPHGWAYIE